MIIKTSAHSHSDTVKRLEQVLEEKGIGVFAKLDHAQNAKKAELSLPPTTVVMFGNPKLGTPLMQANRAIGIDLPMKMLIWEEADGTVLLGYVPPRNLAERHDLEGVDPVLEKMTGALDGLSNFATRP